MPHELARIAARLFNTPLLVLPEVAETIAANLEERLAGIGAAPHPSPLPALRGDGVQAPDYEEPVLPDLYAVENGVATIPIHGELVNRGSWLNSASGLTSYEGLQAAFRAAAADPRVASVVLDIDSPGGEAAGAMETADEVRELSAQKPVVAYVNAKATSAAYAIASGARQIVVPPSGMVGSIGVVLLHLDRSAQLAQRGVKPTLIKAGAYKADGHPYAALDPEVRARLQGEVDEVYGLFVETVGKHRPSLGPEGARKTEAGVFMGRKAVEAGLADRVGDLRTALKAVLPRTAPSPFVSSRKDPMTEELIFTQAAHDAAVANAVAASRRDLEAQHAAALSAQVDEALRTGAANERKRIQAILASEGAKGKTALASHFALATDVSPEAAASALAAAASEAAPAGRMGAVPTPKLTAGGGTPQGSDPDSDWSAVAASVNASLPRGAIIPATAAGRI